MDDITDIEPEEKKKKEEREFGKVEETSERAIDTRLNRSKRRRKKIISKVFSKAEAVIDATFKPFKASSTPTPEELLASPREQTL